MHRQTLSLPDQKPCDAKGLFRREEGLVRKGEGFSGKKVKE
jgi:hypothetical protein